jgi:hypothetical protein
MVMGTHEKEGGNILLKGKYAKKTKRESSSNTEASGEV